MTQRCIDLLQHDCEVLYYTNTLLLHQKVNLYPKWRTTPTLALDLALKFTAQICDFSSCDQTVLLFDPTKLFSIFLNGVVIS